MEGDGVGSGEVVVCGVPFGGRLEAAALKNLHSIGVTSVQVYTFWRDFEPGSRGVFVWDGLDRKVSAIAEAGLKYVPFIIMGPKYAAPEWWLKSPGHVGLRCLEHGKESPVESVWNMTFREEIDRVLGAFAGHYMPWNVMESVQPGICGDYGEAIFPALGNWPGDYHTHRGWWCGDSCARESFRNLAARISGGSVDALNKKWRTSYRDFAEAEPFLPHRAPSRTACFDMIRWYQESMTDLVDFWMGKCAEHFPGIPAYICTGGADDEASSGALFAAQAKAAARHGGGVRLTNEVNKFDENFRLCAHTAAACRFYGAFMGLEPVGPMTTEGVLNRIFGSAAFGNRQIFHYYSNLYNVSTGEELPAAAHVREYSRLAGDAEPDRGIAFFWPVDQALLEGRMPPVLTDALKKVRREYPVTPVSESMILDGALDNFSFMIMAGAESVRREALECIAEWVNSRGGKLLSAGRCLDIEKEPVAAFDSVFGIMPDSEEAWGHHTERIRGADGFEAVAACGDYHAEKGWLGLSEDVVILSSADDGPGRGEGAAESTRTRSVSAMFIRRHRGGGAALMYCGPTDFERDAQACFTSSGTLPALLDDVCAACGIEPLGTRPGETARARTGGRIMVLAGKSITVSDCG